MSRAEISYILHLHLYLGHRLSLLTIVLEMLRIMLVQTFYHRHVSMSPFSISTRSHMPVTPKPVEDDGLTD